MHETIMKQIIFVILSWIILVCASDQPVAVLHEHEHVTVK
jgi:hypothetical protein